jgi:hypothetical protein
MKRSEFTEKFYEINEDNLNSEVIVIMYWIGNAESSLSHRRAVLIFVLEFLV